MPLSTQPDALCNLLLASYGLTTEQVMAMPVGAAERMAAGRLQNLEFDYAAKDLITIVATTNLIPAGDDHRRVALIAAIQTVGARQWTTAAMGYDTEFEALRQGVTRLVFHLLSLRRAQSETEAGRWSMLDGIRSPDRYSEIRHQELFETVIECLESS